MGQIGLPLDLKSHGCKEGRNRAAVNLWCVEERREEERGTIELGAIYR
jgi:hypothetical protein